VTPLELSKKIAGILDNKKATDISVLEIGKLTALGDYFVVASADNTNHVRALSEEVEEQLMKLGFTPKRIEGQQTCTWVLMDYYDVMVHIFYQQTREFYALDRLWADAPRVDLTGIVE